MSSIRIVLVHPILNVLTHVAFLVVFYYTLILPNSDSWIDTRIYTNKSMTIKWISVHSRRQLICSLFKAANGKKNAYTNLNTFISSLFWNTERRMKRWRWKKSLSAIPVYVLLLRVCFVWRFASLILICVRRAQSTHKPSNRRIKCDKTCFIWFHCMHPEWKTHLIIGQWKK